MDHINALKCSVKEARSSNLQSIFTRRKFSISRVKPSINGEGQARRRTIVDVWSCLALCKLNYSLTVSLPDRPSIEAVIRGSINDSCGGALNTKLFCFTCIVKE